MTREWLRRGFISSYVGWVKCLRLRQHSLVSMSSSMRFFSPRLTTVLEASYCEPYKYIRSSVQTQHHDLALDVQASHLCDYIDPHRPLDDTLLRKALQRRLDLSPDDHTLWICYFLLPYTPQLTRGCIIEVSCPYCSKLSWNERRT